MKNFKKIVSIMLSIVVLLCVSACDNSDKNTEYTTIDADFENVENIEIPVITEEITKEEIADYEEKEPTVSQIGVVVNSWLKVVSIGERDGSVSVLVRNTSEKDVQYAKLSVVCDGIILYFDISTLTAGSSAILTCEDVKFNPKGQYHTWKISDEIIFQEPLSLYPDVFEIGGVDGYISVKNISKKDIDGPIYIHYKNVEDGVFTEGTTYRVTIDGLRKGEVRHINSSNYKKDTSLVMFVLYAE